MQIKQMLIPGVLLILVAVSQSNAQAINITGTVVDSVSLTAIGGASVRLVSDPSAIAKAMEEKFKPLMEAGKVALAEAELDRVLEQLKQEPK